MQAVFLAKEKAGSPFERIFALLLPSAFIVLYCSPFPLFSIPCLFHIFTGLPCPTCGLLRTLMLLKQGRLIQAICFSPLLAVPMLFTIPLFLYCSVVEIFNLSRIRLQFSSPQELRIFACLPLLILAVNEIWNIVHHI